MRSSVQCGPCSSPFCTSDQPRSSPSGNMERHFHDDMVVAHAMGVSLIALSAAVMFAVGVLDDAGRRDRGDGHRPIPTAGSPYSRARGSHTGAPPGSSQQLVADEDEGASSSIQVTSTTETFRLTRHGPDREQIRDTTQAPTNAALARQASRSTSWVGRQHQLDRVSSW